MNRQLTQRWRVSVLSSLPPAGADGILTRRDPVIPKIEKLDEGKNQIRRKGETCEL